MRWVFTAMFVLIAIGLNISHRRSSGSNSSEPPTQTLELPTGKEVKGIERSVASASLPVDESQVMDIADLLSDILQFGAGSSRQEAFEKLLSTCSLEDLKTVLLEIDQSPFIEDHQIVKRALMKRKDRVRYHDLDEFLDGIKSKDVLGGIVFAVTWKSIEAGDYHDTSSINLEYKVHFADAVSELRPVEALSHFNAGTLQYTRQNILAMGDALSKKPLVNSARISSITDFDLKKSVSHAFMAAWLLRDSTGASNWVQAQSKEVSQWYAPALGEFALGYDDRKSATQWLSVINDNRLVESLTEEMRQLKEVAE